MARLTVEDCLDHVDNRFNLVLLAAKRARQIAMGMEPRVPEDNDKPTVIALREIAEGLVSAENIVQKTPEELLEEEFSDPEDETRAENDSE